jgi:1-acyl-sn-glycerol-3-phosphate acyltransferase
MARIFNTIARPFNTLYEYLAMLLGLVSLAFLCLLGLPFAVLLLCLPVKIRVPLGRRFISHTLTIYLWFLKIFCFVRVNTHVLDSLNAQRPLIIIANHPSLLDAIVLLSRLPHATCVMKASLRGNLLFGPMARLSGYISNDDPLQLMRQACDELHGGSLVIIFPEGTRTLAAPINSFGHTCAFISARSGVPIQSLFIEFSTQYLGKYWPIWRKPTLPLRINLRLGLKFNADKDRIAMTERLESYYRENLSS